MGKAPCAGVKPTSLYALRVALVVRSEVWNFYKKPQMADLIQMPYYV